MKNKKTNWLLRNWGKLVAFILCLILIIGPVRNEIIRIVVTTAASGIMGTKVHVDGLSIGILKPTIKITGLKVYNPADFPNEVFVDVNKIEVTYDFNALLRKEIHLPLVVFDLNKIVIVKNEAGMLNVDSLKPVQQEAQKEKTTEKTVDKKRMSFLIDEAHLNLGKVILEDYSKGGAPIVKGYDIGIKDKIYKNINSAQKLVMLIMLEGVSPLGLKNAAIYGASTALGVAFLPAGIATMFLSKDTAIGTFKSSVNKVFEKSVDLLNKIATTTKVNTKNKTITAKVHGAGISLSVSKNKNNKTQVRVKARQLLRPKADVAEGILHQLSKKVK